jgi:DUF1365 family protein
MNSYLYVGQVRHRRFQPRPHAFRYRLFMIYLDLAELDTVFQYRWLWSTRRPALAWFRRRDHFGDPTLPLDHCVRDLVEQRCGRRPTGPIRLLTQLRYLGYCFNPISIYYCFEASGQRVETVVAEVTNTPWGERHCYVLDQVGDRRPQSFAKAMHVSPFLPMGLEYVWRSNLPGEHLGVHLDVLQQGTKLLDATLGLRRQPLTGATLAGTLRRFPWMTLKVAVAIHWQAVRLWLKRIPFFDHPGPSRPSVESSPHE